MSGAVARDGGVSCVNKPVDVNVGQEVGVAQRYTGVVSNQRRVGGVNRAVAIHVSIEKADDNARRGECCFTRTGNIAHLNGHGLHVCDAAERNDHSITAEAGAGRSACAGSNARAPSGHRLVEG